MPDLVQVAVQVKMVNSMTVEVAKAGTTLTHGMPVYKATDERYHPTVATAKLTAAAKGFVLTPALENEFFALAKAGSIDPGADLVIGMPYIVSGNAGGIAPITDAVAGWWVTILGIAKGTRELPISLVYSQAAKV